MSMDRHSRSWPGGPMPPAAYPHTPMGGKYPPHEIGQHLLEIKKELLCRADDQVHANVFGNAVVEMACPDARLMSVLGIVFEPDAPGKQGDVAWSRSLIHLTATMDMGFGPREVEDLLGTRDDPMVFPAKGNWGLIYSPTAEVEAMRADLVLKYNESYVIGAWWAVARWQAMEPMSEIEWRDAVAKCKLIAKCDQQHISYGAAG